VGDITRRSFVKGMAAGTLAGYFTASGLGSTIFRDTILPAPKRKNVDIGEIKGISVKCISETSWFDNNRQTADMRRAGGALVNQYDVEFSHTGVAAGYNGSNAGGFSSLIDVELLDGSHKKILLDTGWNVAWMTERFQAEGVDKMLKNNEIDMLFISHDHYDHFWGIEAVLRHKPDITVVRPSTFIEQSKKLLAGAEFSKPKLKNSIPHTGKTIEHELNKLYQLYPGVAATLFPAPCGRGIYGEQALIFNVKDKGICTITVCAHMGIITLMEYIKANIQGGEKVYGVYGGLHISPFEDWDPQYDDLIRSIPRYNVQRLACNHCTGYITVEKMLAAGIPVIKGTGKNKTKRDTYLGNGDIFEI
jgi:7,8-dihydropterin-6-yl-methyl-4-(beta-D-ribofuranosyl)aminobenzene 5'-phosphate synthase